MNDYMYLFTVFIAMGAVTAAERLLPFACSSWLRKQRWVVLWAVSSARHYGPFGSARLDRLSTRPWRSPASEAAGVFLTLIVQWFVKKPLLSIFAGTAVYVILVNSLFV